MKTRKIIIWIVVLIVLDQGVKLLIANYLQHTQFDIINNVLGFHPIFNEKYSYFTAMLGLNFGLTFHAILLLIIQLIVLFVYIFFKYKRPISKLLDVSYIFGQSALLCVFCGFFLWEKGTLDFILVYPFTVDFKDIYLNIFAILFLFEYCKHRADYKSSMSEFMRYFKHQLNSKKWELLPLNIPH